MEAEALECSCTKIQAHRGLSASLALGLSFTVPQRLQEPSLCVEKDIGAATHGEGPQNCHFHKTERKKLFAPKTVREKVSGD